MHLTDEQLLELDESGELHLAQCQTCSLRAENLKTFRHQLSSLPMATLPRESWRHIQAAQQIHCNEIELARSKKSIRFWQMSSFAIAASLVLALVLPRISTLEEGMSHQDMQLAMLIEQNNVLQQQLINSMRTAQTDQTDLSLVNSQLSILDQSIQSAYMRQLTVEEKSKLWNQRLELIKGKLSKKQAKSLIRI